LTSLSRQDLSSKGAKIFFQSWGNRDGGFHERACASKHSPNSVTHEQVPLKYLSTFGKKKAPQEKRRKKRKRLWYLSRRQQKTKYLRAWIRRRRIYSSSRRKKNTHTHTQVSKSLQDFSSRFYPRSGKGEKKRKEIKILS
jgi:hypothetical protein